MDGIGFKENKDQNNQHEKSIVSDCLPESDANMPFNRDQENFENQTDIKANYVPAPIPNDKSPDIHNEIIKSSGLHSASKLQQENQSELQYNSFSQVTEANYLGKSFLSDINAMKLEKNKIIQRNVHIIAYALLRETNSIIIKLYIKEEETGQNNIEIKLPRGHIPLNVTVIKQKMFENGSYEIQFLSTEDATVSVIENIKGYKPLPTRINWNNQFQSYYEEVTVLRVPYFYEICENCQKFNIKSMIPVCYFKIVKLDPDYDNTIENYHLFGSLDVHKASLSLVGDF